MTNTPDPAPAALIAPLIGCPPAVVSKGVSEAVPLLVIDGQYTMTTPDYTDGQLIDGQRLMRRLQKTASRNDDVFVQPETFTNEATALRHGLSHWHPDNLRAAILHPVEGGWNADIVLRDAPDGHPLVLDKGTGQPFATRRQAEEFLRNFVTAINAAWARDVVLPSAPTSLAA